VSPVSIVESRKDNWLPEGHDVLLDAIDFDDQYAVIQYSTFGNQRAKY